MTISGASPQSPGGLLCGASSQIRRLETQFEIFQTSQGEFASRVNTYIAQLTTRITAIESTIRNREEEIKAAFDLTAAQRASELAAVIAGAKSEFDTQRTQLGNITVAVQQEFIKLQQQVDQGGQRDGQQK